ncbi:insulinase family protein [Nisaea acidiphila]|uniref:Insulinase family protein n=1 Tax=Nisaea acidiphila TaxID=1862145 RepID=A0A9J7AX03_9PROT|nr:pitrilysin family protein [Nisaea acidiphila]UUX51895.1 insulinase family protein [Nisaea acidiphila]
MIRPAFGRGPVPILAAFCFLIAAGVADADAKVYEPESIMLDNGMQVVAITDQRVPVVTHMVWYRVGGADEAPGETGLAHFLEHLLFKGTDKVPSGAFSRAVSRNGGQDNAFTGYDYTAYFQTIASDKLPMVMEMEADRMVNLTLDPDEVAAERQVVLEERRSRVDNSPAALLGERTDAALYLNYPYRRPLIGWAHEIEALTRENALAFYRKWYAPNNAILVVAGDITMERLKPLAEKYYGAIPARSVPERIRPAEPEQISARRVELTHPLAGQVSWARRWLAPSRFWGESRHVMPLSVLAEVIGGGSTSRLYKELVIEQKVALSVGAFYGGGTIGPATFGFYGQPADGHTVQDLERAVESELEAILRDGVDPAEVARAVKAMEASAVYARDSVTAPAHSVGRSLAVGRTIDEIESWPEEVGAVTVEQVMEAARAVLRKPGHVTSVLRPKPAS